jgi:hypothetical protein
MRKLELWLTATLWLAAAILLPMAALEPVSAGPPGAAAPKLMVGACADGSPLLAMGCASASL